MRFWELDTGHELARMVYRQAHLAGATMDKTGQRLLSAANDGTAHIWVLPTPEALAELVRSTLARCLSDRQRTEYNLDQQPLPAWCKGKYQGVPARSEIANR